MHKVLRLIKDINRTHKGLGALIAMNILAAKAKKTILNISPAGCGKSVSTNTVADLLPDRNIKFTSLTLAGMIRLKRELNEYDGHILIDDLGEEKSNWSRVSTVTVLTNLVYGHYIDKITHNGRIQITNFYGSVSLNIQPVILNSLVQSDEWVSVIRDKVIRYYHLIRPVKPQQQIPQIKIGWGKQLTEVTRSKHKGKLWYELINIGLTQWGYSRVVEHISDMLKALAALDDRNKVNVSDYVLLIKLLQPLKLEPNIVETYSFEQGRVFDNNLYCILVELASFREPTIHQLCVDYKVSISTAHRLIKTVPEWCWLKTNSPTKVCPTERTATILQQIGAYKKW